VFNASVDCRSLSKDKTLSTCRNCGELDSTYVRSA